MLVNRSPSIWMDSLPRFWLGALLLVAVSGCAPVISPALREQAMVYLSFSQVHVDPSGYNGKIVIWSGTILKTTNTESGTLLEILQHDADSRGMPINEDQSEGRFMVLDPGFLDAAIYAPGRLVTVAGEIQGSRIEPMGEIRYRYPYLISKEIYLWPKERFERYPYDDPYYYYGAPWWRMQLGTDWGW